MADQDDQKQQERGLTSQVGPVEINWPLTVGYYGGIGLAVATEMVTPPRRARSPATRATAGRGLPRRWSG